MFNLNLWRKLFPKGTFFPIEHEWGPLGEYRNECSKCGKRRYVMENRYPLIGESRYSWSDPGKCEPFENNK